MKRIIIIGGGISGLAAAYSLKKVGHSVTLLEKSARIGGVIQTVQKSGYLAEAGPNSMQLTEIEQTYLLGELGLADRIVEPSPLAKNRFVVKNGQLLPVPLGPGSFLKTPLFSLPTKLRIASEPLKKNFSLPDERSLAALVREHFGQEVLDYAVNPMIAGIYAGDPTQLSAEHAFPKIWAWKEEYGSLIKGAIKSKQTNRKLGIHFKPYMVSFRDGMQELPNAFAQKLESEIQLNAEIDSIEENSNQWTVTWSNVEKQSQQATADHLVLATPAHVLNKLPLPKSLKDIFYDMTELLYPPISCLVLGFESQYIQHALDGFGALVPEKEGLNILGTLFSSSLFENRAPSSEHTTLTIFAGGTRQPDIAQLETQALLKKVIPDLQTLIGLSTTEPSFVHHTFWDRAIPQYNIDYGRFDTMYQNAEAKYPNLSILGNHRGGIAVGQCITNGTNLAEKISV